MNTNKRTEAYSICVARVREMNHQMCKYEKYIDALIESNVVAMMAITNIVIPFNRFFFLFFIFFLFIIDR